MSLYRIYEYLVHDLADPRSTNILINTPWPVLTIIASYLYFVRVCGPKFMKNREAYKIDHIIKLYNLIQIIWNMYIFSFIIPVLAEWRLGKFSLWCLPLNFSDDNKLAAILHVGFTHYYFNKVFDICDTVFFILRKKFNQITYMHVYHHAIMCFASWSAIKYGPGGCPISVGILNALVHVFMYTYYQFALMGWDQWLWWKRYLTQMQIIQFALLLIHNVPVFFSSTCYYNPYISVIAVMQPAYFFYLFIKYYIQTYLNKKKVKTQ